MVDRLLKDESLETTMTRPDRLSLPASDVGADIRTRRAKPLGALHSDRQADLM